MRFVFSGWIIVLIVLVLAIAGAVVAFVMMDKKDKVIINDFLKKAQADQEQPVAEVALTEEKVEDKKE